MLTFIILFAIVLVYSARNAGAAPNGATPASRPLPFPADPRTSPFLMDVDNSSITVPTTAWAPALLSSGLAFNLYGYIGLMPRINADGSFVNGGVPQAGNLTAHLAKLRTDLARLLPANASGACLLDWEFWRADWDGTGAQYQDASIALAGGDVAAAEAAYEAGARVFFEGSLRAVAEWYPNCVAGIYAYPQNDWSHGGYVGSNASAMRATNDRLGWLWAASSALFPSVYLTSPAVSKYDGQTTREYVFSTVAEAVRCASSIPAATRPLVLPLQWYVYDAFPRPSGTWPTLTPDDAAVAMTAPADAGADALLLWGAVGNAPFLPEQLVDYLSTTLGPAVNASYNAQLACADARCSGAGRCVGESACVCVPPAAGPTCAA